jgi:hypothetical protein
LNSQRVVISTSTSTGLERAFRSYAPRARSVRQADGRGMNAGLTMLNVATWVYTAVAVLNSAM